MQIIQQHSSQQPQPQGWKQPTPSSSAARCSLGLGPFPQGARVRPDAEPSSPTTSLPHLQALPPSSKSMDPSSSSLPTSPSLICRVAR